MAATLLMVVGAEAAIPRISRAAIAARMLVSRLVNSLTYCVALRPLAKAPVRRCGGSTSSAGNT
ncbi:MAG: hypothetical protein SVX28_07770, partial [Pseudomonadota bacterium]|nr:hypothetical protein [Pseudomonadota bacterium]